MKINNYGELLSAGLKMDLLAYSEYGSYQGDYIAILSDNNGISLYRGSYGSCSGCDWLEAERDWNTYEVSDEQIKNYCNDEKPFLFIPFDKLDKVIDSDDISVFFPANTRNEYDDFSWDDIRNLLKEAKDKHKNG